MRQGSNDGPVARRDGRIVSASRHTSDVSGARDVYKRYLTELSAYPLLDAEQEQALARELEECELSLWRALLRHGAVRALIDDALRPLPDGWHAFDASDERAVGELARALRARDETRVLRARAEQQLRLEDPDVERHLRAYRAAMDRMVTANLRLVVSLARQYGAPRLLSTADFVQEGNLGLMRAAERFDYRRGVRFSTYAVWWIRHAFNRALSDRGRLVRVPGHALEDAHRLSRAQASLVARQGSAPSVEQLAEVTGLAPERIALFQDYGVGRDTVSLDREVGEKGGTTLLDRLPAEETDPGAELDAVMREEQVAPLLERLSAMEADILRFRFGLEDGEERTLREIGEKYGLTRERIRQLQERGLGKLRKALQSTSPGDEPVHVAIHGRG